MILIIPQKTGRSLKRVQIGFSSVGRLSGKMKFQSIKRVVESNAFPLLVIKQADSGCRLRLSKAP